LLPTLSIIIVNYKTPELIAGCVASIYKYVENLSFEVIIVNNASKADDERFVKGQFPEVKWLEMGYNAGFGRANNLGMKKAKGNYFLLLNSDTELLDDSVQRILQRYKSDSNIAVAGASQIAPDGSSKRSAYSFASVLRYSWILFPHIRADDFLLRLLPEPVYNNPEEVDYVVGAFMLFRREIFEETGGFDEGFFMYGEDIEWGYRLQKLGKAIIFKDCKFIHDEWGSSPENKASRMAAITYFNRFDAQSQLSNLVYIRKSYGVLYFIGLMLHYWAWVPAFYLMKVVVNIKSRKSPFVDLDAQRKFAGTIRTFSRFFFAILLDKPTFYKTKK
jgi:hypothetical protein